MCTNCTVSAVVYNGATALYTSYDICCSTLCRNNTQGRILLYSVYVEINGFDWQMSQWYFKTLPENKLIITNGINIPAYISCIYQHTTLKIYIYLKNITVKFGFIIANFKPIPITICGNPYFGMCCGNQFKMLYLGEYEVLQLTCLTGLYFWTIVKTLDTTSESTWPSGNVLR